MKLFIRITILFLIALAVAGFSRFNTGSVSLFFGNYEAILSLNLLLIIWLVSFVIAYYLFRMYVNLRRLPNRIQKSRARNALIGSRLHLNSAGLYYFEGKFRSSYDSALKSIKREINPDNKFLAYIIAFRAASIMRDSAKETKISTEISQFSDPKWRLARYLVIAENFYNEQRFGQCIDNLNAVIQLDYKHVSARRMLLKVYLNLTNYTQAYEVLTWLLRHDSLREHQVNKYKTQVMGGLFKSLSTERELNRYYNKLSREERTNFLYGKLYFDGLLRLGEHEVALDFLSSNLKVETMQLIYNEAVLSLSKKITDNNLINKLKSIAEKSLTLNQRNHSLLLALGILSYQHKEWQKSQGYLEDSISIKPSLDAYVFLSLVAKETNNNQLLAESNQELVVNIRNLS